MKNSDDNMEEVLQLFFVVVCVIDLAFFNSKLQTDELRFLPG